MVLQRQRLKYNQISLVKVTKAGGDGPCCLPFNLTIAASDINLYCRFGVLVRTHWDTMDKYDLNTFNRQEDVMFSSLVNATPGYESETVEL